VTNFWAESSGKNKSLALSFFHELYTHTIGGLCQEVRDKLTTFNVNTFFSERSKLPEMGDMASVSQKPIKKI
jgi:hypothetical protein